MRAHTLHTQNSQNILDYNLFLLLTFIIRSPPLSWTRWKLLSPLFIFYFSSKEKKCIFQVKKKSGVSSEIVLCLAKCVRIEPKILGWSKCVFAKLNLCAWRRSLIGSLLIISPIYLPIFSFEEDIIRYFNTFWHFYLTVYASTSIFSASLNERPKYVLIKMFLIFYIVS